MQHIDVKKKKLNFQTNEAYKTLRTNVEFAGENLKTIAVTSCLPNEGKSTTSLQLAMAFADAGKKTLLVDADLRKSEMQKISLSGAVKAGLSDFLVGKEKLMDVLVSTNVPNFYVIFAGHMAPNPSELLGNNYFKALLDAAKETFDVVIIDTPPVGSIIDAAIIASQTDGVILVIKHASISYKFAQKVRDQLKTSGGKLLGVVLNEVGGKGKGVYGSYYGKYYGSYYGSYYGKAYAKAYGEYSDEKQ